MPHLAFLRDNARWLAAGALLAFLSSFGQTFVISVFAGEIRAEFGLSHGQWGAICAAGTAASAALIDAGIAMPAPLLGYAAWLAGSAALMARARRALALSRPA